MQRTALTLLGALLISGLALQLAAASEHHHRSKAYFGSYLPKYRGTYNQVDGPVNVTPRVFDRFARRFLTTEAPRQANVPRTNGEGAWPHTVAVATDPGRRT